MADDDDERDLDAWEVEIELRSVAMLPANGPAYWSREKALRFLGQLLRLLRDRRRETNS